MTAEEFLKTKDYNTHFDGFYECFYKIEEGLLDYMGNFN